MPYLRHEYFGRIVSMLAYRRGFLNVACTRGKAMRRPWYVGRVTDTDSHAFFVYRREHSFTTNAKVGEWLE